MDVFEDTLGSTTFKNCKFQRKFIHNLKYVKKIVYLI